MPLTSPPGERCREAAQATRTLAGWATTVHSDQLDAPDAERLSCALFDVLAACAVGARTTEQAAYRTAWHCPPGTAPVLLGDRLTDAQTAMTLNGAATVCRELDEGGKFAKGHPGAHCFPAVLALAAELDATTTRTSTALLVGYEVAARFGRATALHQGTHPHGNWGVTGAAAGCAVLLGLGAEATAAAIDTAAGMPIAGHFDTALDGNPVRDLWIGAANSAGLSAARLAAAGVAKNTGTAALSIGHLLGRFDPDALVEDLGERLELRHNYFKRHSSCSFTHPVADLMLGARDRLFAGRAPEAESVRAIRVHTHRLAAGLDRPEWSTPLGAMFSIPFVAAAALLYGEVSPRVVARTPADAPALAALAGRVRVVDDEELSARLPAHRAARVDIELADGTHHGDEVDNPVGDTDFHPFDRGDLAAIFDPLLGGDGEVVGRIDRVVAGMSAHGRCAQLLAPLATAVQN